MGPDLVDTDVDPTLARAMRWAVEQIAAATAEATVAAFRDRLEQHAWLTTEEAAAYVRLPLGTFEKRAADGMYRRRRHGRRWLYRRDELDQDMNTSADEIDDLVEMPFGDPQ